MEIASLTIGDLESALRDDTLWNAQILPITKHRAESHVRNPRATRDDLSLLIAYDQGNVIAYIGILPDTLFVESERIAMGWLSTWWVDPAHANSGVALILLLKAFAGYGGRIGVYDFSGTAEKVYDSSRRFSELKRLDAFEISVANGSQAQSWIREVCNQDYKWERIERIDDLTAELIDSCNRTELTRRGARELRWILEYPWVVSPESAFPMRHHYYFSSSARRFEYHPVRIWSDSGELIGFILFRIRDDRLAVPYIHFREAARLRVLLVALEFFLESDTTTLLTVNPSLLNLIASPTIPGLSLSPAWRRAIISRSLAERLPASFILQDGDGDSVFT